MKAAVGFRPGGNGILGGIVGGLKLQAAVLSIAGGSDVVDAFGAGVV